MNYLHCQQHVEPMTKSHKLQRFFMNPSVQSCCLTKDNSTLDRINLVYWACKLQDQTSLVWLQSTPLSWLSRVTPRGLGEDSWILWSSNKISCNFFS